MSQHTKQSNKHGNKATAKSNSKQKRTDRCRRGALEGIEGFLGASNPLLSPVHLVEDVHLGLGKVLLQLEFGQLGLDDRAELLVNGLIQGLVGLSDAIEDGVQIFLSLVHLVADFNLGHNEVLFQLEFGQLGLDDRAELLVNGLIQGLVGLSDAIEDGVQIFELLGRSHVSAQKKQTNSNKR